MTEPGWYHATGDPEGTQRYWDGNQWVGEPRTATQPATPSAPPTAVPSAPPAAPGGVPFGDAAPAEAGAGLDKRWIFAAIGAAVLAIIGALGPWVTFFGISAAGTEGDGTLVIVLAVIAGGAAAFGLSQPARKKAIQITYAVCGALVVLIVLVNIGDVTDVGAGWGFWLDLVAGIVMTALGAVGDRLLPSSN